MFRNLYVNHKPTQLYHLGTGSIRCQLKPPCPALEASIYYYWWLDIDCESTDLEVVPDAAADLVLCPDIENFAVVYLPTIEKFSIALNGPIRYAGVCFNVASLAQTLGVGVKVLSSYASNLSLINELGLNSLVKQIQVANGIDEASECFDVFFSQRLNSLSVDHDLMRRVVDCLEGESVKNIACQCGMSERQFRRVTSELSGLSPKQILRVARLQSSLHSMLNLMPQCDNFYDDSHRIKELKRLTGLTPRQFQKLAEKYNS